MDETRTTALLERTLEHAREYLESLQTAPVTATLDLHDLRTRLGVELTDEGVDPTVIIDDLVAATDGGHVGNAGGRFFAWVVGSSLPSAMAADWLTTTWDQNSALHACAPAAAVVEEIAGTWLLELLDLPRDASFAFTTGCQMAHFTALAAARQEVLRRANWDVNADGLFGAPPIRVLTSAARHASVDRALRYLGIGDRHLVALDIDGEERVTVESFERALSASESPTILVLDAADLNVAAFDPFSALIPRAREAGAWVHVDGAFGLFARASRKHRGLAEGIELADSWACDGHKWLNVPYDCGFTAVRNREAHRAAMRLTASYLSEGGDARDQMDWNPEWSRRARGFTVYAALRELGKNGLERMVDRGCAHAVEIVDGIGELTGAEVLWRPHLNQGLVRFPDPRPEATPADHDAHTEAVMQAINATGELFVSGTTWRGMRAMRISVVSWKTSEEDVERAVAAVARVLEALPR